MRGVVYIVCGCIFVSFLHLLFCSNHITHYHNKEKKVKPHMRQRPARSPNTACVSVWTANECHSAAAGGQSGHYVEQL